jgi:asparagine synthase (glutamine-hydrolysing)
MCGFVGISGAVEPRRLEEAVHRLAHRGPDDEGLWWDERAGVGLGHRRLAIIDLSPAGRQPMWDATGQVVIVFNGEIYNYRELRQELLTRGVAFRSQSDTEVLLNLYLTEGVEMLPRLNGIFAFALWDTRDRSLFVARDALGVKPLYYAATPAGVAFASEIKGLLPLLPEPGELDLEALHRYLCFLWCPGEGTPLKRVRKLEPGEAMVVRDGRIARRWTWYRLPVFREVRPDLSEREVIGGTVAHLRQAVYRQLVADVPVGAFLSGGLDSSAVVAFAREQNSEIRCFSIDLVGGQDAGFADDLPYARQVARHLGVPLEVVEVDAGRMAADLEHMVVQLDEPLADPSPLNVLYISRLAREHGVLVLLAGTGGDDLFAGYRRHQALMLSRYWALAPTWLRGWLGRFVRGLDQRRPLVRRASRWLDGAALDGDAGLARAFLWGRREDLLALYTPDVRASLARTSAEAPLLEFLAPLADGPTDLERLLVLEQRFFLADHNLIYFDKMSMAVGVEVRVPFLDLGLVEFAARIPASLKVHRGQSKWVLKRAMAPFLPSEVIHRPKTGFGAPLRRWLRGELRPLVQDVLSETSLRRRGLFDPGAVRRLIAAHYAGRVDAAYTVLSLLCIELWCRAFLDRQPAYVSG